MDHIDPRLKFWMVVSEALAELALSTAESAVQQSRSLLRPRRRGAYRTRRPGGETPHWNIVAPLIAARLTRYGAKARLARYLGIPRQRLQDFLRARDRLPDAELLLRMLNWLSVDAQHGQDLSV